MGTTLTGTTPQDTYDSLIKVTDNGPLSGTAKYLSDGLGNDSTLALSTANVGIGTTSPAVYGGWRGLDIRGGNGGHLIVANTADTNRGELYTDGNGFNVSARTNNALLLKTNDTEKVRITAAGNVGIGTSSPSYTLQVRGASAAIAIDRTSGDQPKLAFTASGSEYASIISSALNGENRFSIGPDAGWGGYHTFYTNTAERFRITNNGVTFNGDTAAANALDDYEEGTFTPTIVGSTTAGTATYGGGQSGTYTKIGNVVYFNIYLGYSAGTGTGDLRIAGLPFTIPAADLPSFTFGVFLNVALTALNVPIAGGIGSTTQIYINQIPTGGGAQTSVPYDDSAVIQLSGFYRV
jgi:hypothetical protein